MRVFKLACFNAELLSAPEGSTRHCHGTYLCYCWKLQLLGRFVFLASLRLTKRATLRSHMCDHQGPVLIAAAIAVRTHCLDRYQHRHRTAPSSAAEQQYVLWSCVPLISPLGHRPECTFLSTNLDPHARWQPHTLLRARSCFFLPLSYLVYLVRAHGETRCSFCSYPPFFTSPKNTGRGLVLVPADRGEGAASCHQQLVRIDITRPRSRIDGWPLLSVCTKHYRYMCLTSCMWLLPLLYRVLSTIESHYSSA